MRLRVAHLLAQVGDLLVLLRRAGLEVLDHFLVVGELLAERGVIREKFVHPLLGFPGLAEFRQRLVALGGNLVALGLYRNDLALRVGQLAVERGDLLAGGVAVGW